MCRRDDDMQYSAVKQMLIMAAIVLIVLLLIGWVAYYQWFAGDPCGKYLNYSDGDRYEQCLDEQNPEPPVVPW